MSKNKRGDPRTTLPPAGDFTQGIDSSQICTTKTVKLPTFKFYIEPRKRSPWGINL